MELLKLNQVSYQYEKTAKIILDGINFSFEAGKLYCINGASGAGKSTLLSLIAGLDVPTSGKIFLTEQILPKWTGMITGQKR